MALRCLRHTAGALVAAALICLTAAALLGQARPRENVDCLSNLKQYALGMLMYVQDYDERMPPMVKPEQVQNRLNPYIKNRAVYVCPVTRTAYLPNPALSSRHLAAIDIPARTLMLRDALPHTDAAGRKYWNVAYADGHVASVTSEPRLGKPAPPPTAQDRVRALQAEIKQLRLQRARLDARIAALEREAARLKRTGK